MMIELNPRQAEVVDRAIRAGLIDGAHEVVEAGIQTIESRLEAELPKKNLSPEEWSRAFHAWIDSHSAEGPLLSDEAMDRESIYGDRGL